jgi:hypothetical protein
MASSLGDEGAALTTRGAALAVLDGAGKVPKSSVLMAMLRL